MIAPPSFSECRGICVFTAKSAWRARTYRASLDRSFLCVGGVIWRSLDLSEGPFSFLIIFRLCSSYRFHSVVGVAGATGTAGTTRGSRDRIPCSPSRGPRYSTACVGMCHELRRTIGCWYFRHRIDLYLIARLPPAVQGFRCFSTARWNPAALHAAEVAVSARRRLFLGFTSVNKRGGRGGSVANAPPSGQLFG